MTVTPRASPRTSNRRLTLLNCAIASATALRSNPRVSHAAITARQLRTLNNPARGVLYCPNSLPSTNTENEVADEEKRTFSARQRASLTRPKLSTRQNARAESSLTSSESHPAIKCPLPGIRLINHLNENF